MEAGYCMAESITRPDLDHMNEPGDAPGQNIPLNGAEETPHAGLSGSPPKVIWTQRFMVIFALTLVIGLSAGSLLTQGWFDGYYVGQWIFQAYVIIICLCWLALTAVARLSWVRMGGIFGCIWALFMTVNIVISALYIDPGSLVSARVNAATCIALLGAYICLSIARTPFSRLDPWLFGLAPIAGSSAVAIIFFLTPANERSLTALESFIATIALILCILVWWLRPTCWKTQPGPTFLFGCIPVLLLLLAIPSFGFNVSNFFLAHVVLHPVGDVPDNQANFFFSQVALLCMLLGTMRVLQGEIRESLASHSS